MGEYINKNYIKQRIMDSDRNKLWHRDVLLSVINSAPIVYVDTLDNDKVYYEYPCSACYMADSCDGWEARFCCTRCEYDYDGDPPCDDCDPGDL